MSAVKLYKTIKYFAERTCWLIATRRNLHGRFRKKKHKLLNLVQQLPHRLICIYMPSYSSLTCCTNIAGACIVVRNYNALSDFMRCCRVLEINRKRIGGNRYTHSLDL